jgi:excisionase family DNA binding protein
MRSALRYDQLEDQTLPESLLTSPQTQTQTLTAETKYGRSVSLMQAAALLQVSRRTIYNRIRDGHLATIRIHGSQRVLTSSLFGKEDARLPAHAPEAAQAAQL